jgi:dihydroorotate dehydrogenase (NAD+) catalytic subunit
VQVGTATFANPRAPLAILEGMEAWLAAEHIDDVRDLIGAARAGPMAAHRRVAALT